MQGGIPARTAISEILFPGADFRCQRLFLTRSGIGHKPTLSDADRVQRAKILMPKAGGPLLYTRSSWPFGRSGLSRISGFVLRVSAGRGHAGYG
jgi:hypothetical protein